MHKITIHGTQLFEIKQQQQQNNIKCKNSLRNRQTHSLNWMLQCSIGQFTLLCKGAKQNCHTPLHGVRGQLSQQPLVQVTICACSAINSIKYIGQTWEKHGSEATSGPLRILSYTVVDKMASHIPCGRPQGMWPPTIPVHKVAVCTKEL